MIEAAARFSQKYIPEPNTGCFLWAGAADRRGYGRFNFGGTTILATHAALALRGMKLAKGQYVCHRCDTPACVNPDHLFLGDAVINREDARGKGRLPAMPVAKIEQICAAISAGASASGVARSVGAHPRTAAAYARRIGRPVADNRTKTHCKNGHALSGDNLKVTARQRVCVTCTRERGARWARDRRARDN